MALPLGKRSSSLGGKRTSQGIDGTSATTSGLENFLRFPSLTESNSEDDLIAEEELMHGGANRPFVKLKRDHWVEPRHRSQCGSCQKSFGLTSKKFNCRKCGEIFCERCCRYRRRLSPNAQPSIDGNIYRVCYRCSDIAEQSFGVTRSHTEFFAKERDGKRINVQKELQRLVEGFRANVKASRLDSVMTETISNIKVPLWQRSYKWLESKEVEWCSKCTAKFTMFMQKHHCRICGSVFCHKCSNQDLMLYYNEKSFAKWALIRVVGCPDSEPSICLYLTVCCLCHEQIESVQVSQFYSKTSNDNEDVWKKLIAVEENLFSCQSRIKSDMIKYQEMVEDIVYLVWRWKTWCWEKLDEMPNRRESSLNRLAKLQTDLSDLFSQQAALISELMKILKSIGGSGRLLLLNISAASSRFYNRNMAEFKYFKETVSETIPASELVLLQRYCDKQAINCLQITTRRLGLELLNMSSQYGIEPTVALEIRTLDSTCLEELQKFIEAIDEDWEEHHHVLKSLVKNMFQSSKMIVPSRTSISKDGTPYLQSFLRERSKEVLIQAQIQLLAKSSETKFTKSKQALEDLVKSL